MMRRSTPCSPSTSLDAVADQPRALAELHRVLRPGGAAVFQVAGRGAASAAWRTSLARASSRESRARSRLRPEAVARHALIAEEETYCVQEATERAVHPRAGAPGELERGAQRGAREARGRAGSSSPGSHEGAVAAVDADSRPDERIGARNVPSVVQPAVYPAAAAAARTRSSTRRTDTRSTGTGRPSASSIVSRDRAAPRSSAASSRSVRRAWRDRVRADLPPGVREQPELVPAQHSRSAHRRHGHEHRAGQAELRQDRKRMLEHAPARRRRTSPPAVCSQAGSSTARLNVIPRSRGRAARVAVLGRAHGQHREPGKRPRRRGSRDEPVAALRPQRRADDIPTWKANVSTPAMGRQLRHRLRRPRLLAGDRVRRPDPGHAGARPRALRARPPASTW